MESTVLERKAGEYLDQLSGKSAQDVIRFFRERFGDKLGFSSSLSAEDQVITDMISKVDPNIRVFTLDTGRMFPEVYDLISATNSRYKINIEVYFPDPSHVEQMVRQKGINLFYESIENRKFCCHVRKIEPLRRAMQGLEVWISGLRRDQSATRKESGLVEWDNLNGKIKVNPLIDWSEEQVWQYIREQYIPYNPLHDQGYPSIGCQPCTRAIEPGEDIRSGRWWWEHPETRECGLHKR
jgi:phosphoadenosine phosphosulfate reductase